MRFIYNSSGKSLKQRKSGSLNTEEVRAMELLWIQVMQQTFYDGTKQMKWLKKNLGVYVDDQNVLRCKGRFENSLLTFKERNPILLPKTGHLQLLLI